MSEEPKKPAAKASSKGKRSGGNRNKPPKRGTSGGPKTSTS